MKKVRTLKMSKRLLTLFLCLFLLIAFLPAIPAKAATKDGFSLLEAQIGFKPFETKYALLTAPNYRSDAPEQFTLVRDGDQAEVYTGDVTYWGQVWGQCFWMLDFSSYTEEGDYHVEVAAPDLRSTTFSIQENLFTDQTLLKTSVDFLEQIIDDKMGWQDCGTDLRAVEGHAAMLFGLQDSYATFGEDLSAADHQRFLDQLKHGTDYLVALQNEDGSFKSEYYMQPLVTWPKSLEASIALIRSYAVTGDTAYRDAAVRGWNWCMSRPYFTQSEIMADIDSTRKIYGRDSSWVPSTELRARDKLLVVWGGCEFFKYLSDDSYQAVAKEYAQDVYNLQYLDYTDPEYGVYGNFYAWEDQDVFQKAWEHGGWDYNCGSVFPDHILGLLELCTLFPDDPDAVTWEYVLKVYADQYLKKVTEMNPFGVYPLTGLYDNEIRFFGPTWHGGDGLYGNIAKNAMLLAHYFDDPELQDIADKNLQWVGGLNFGLLKDGQRQSTSMIVGVGKNSVTSWTLIEGGITNGLSSSGDFTIDDPLTLFDAPVGYTTEEWIVHNGGWLSGLSEVEKPSELLITANHQGLPVNADVTVTYGGATVTAQTTDGQAVLTGLTPMETATVTASYGGRTMSRNVNILSGQTFASFDFAQQLSVAVDADVNALTGTVTVHNDGSMDSNVSLSLDAVGVTLSQSSFTGAVPAGGDAAFAFTFADSDPDKVQPLYIRAKASGDFGTQKGTFFGELPAPMKADSFLNHDFETGDLTGWTVLSGTAFSSGNISNMNTAAAGTGEYFNKHGDYFYSGYGQDLDAPQGEMKSESFTVGAGKIRLKVGGGNDSEHLYVALADAASGRILEKATGLDSEKMRWVEWKTDEYLGKECYILVADHSSGGWGHINVDDINVPLYRDAYYSDFGDMAIYNADGAAAGTASISELGMTVDAEDSVLLSNNKTAARFEVTGNITPEIGQAGLVFGAAKEAPFAGYSVRLDVSDGKVKLMKGGLVLAHADASIQSGTAYELKVAADGSDLTVTLDGQNCLTYGSYEHQQGYLGIAASGKAVFNHMFILLNDGFATNLSGFVNNGQSAAWKATPDGLFGSSADAAYVSDTTGTDFVLEGDINIETAQAASFAVRVQGDAYVSGGYFICVDQQLDTIKLFKLWPYADVQVVNRSFEPNTTYHLRAVVNGNHFQVYLNDEAAPVLDCYDSTYVSGNIGVHLIGGSAYYNNLYYTSSAAEPNFNTNLTNLTMYGQPGTQQIVGNGLVYQSADGALMSDRTGGNFTFETDVELLTATAAALVFRSDADPYAGGGYFLNIDKDVNRVKLFKLWPYNEVAVYDVPIDQGVTYHLKVTADGSRFKVYLNDGADPVIDVQDSTFASGNLGVNTFGGSARFDNLFVE